MQEKHVSTYFSVQFIFGCNVVNGCGLCPWRAARWVYCRWTRRVRLSWVTSPGHWPVSGSSMRRWTRPLCAPDTPTSASMTRSAPS